MFDKLENCTWLGENFIPPQSLSTFSSKFSIFAEHVLYFYFAVFDMFLLIALAACNYLGYRGSQKG
jgi:hypothetical protein